MTTREQVWPILVLTLEGDEARRAPLLARLEALGLPFRIVTGIDGRQGLPEHWLAGIDRAGARARLGRAMTDGEFACALSHREIYRMILDNGWPGAVVLEDDVRPGPQFRDFMAARLYERAGLLLLGHSRARVRGRGVTILPGVRMARLALSCDSSAAYCVGRGVARMLAEANTPVRGVADWPCDIARCGAAVLVPQIVTHPDPLLGMSHLRGDRDLAMVAGGRRQPAWRSGAAFTRAYWRRWFALRLSRRVS